VRNNFKRLFVDAFLYVPLASAIVEAKPASFRSRPEIASTKIIEGSIWFGYAMKVNPVN